MFIVQHSFIIFTFFLCLMLFVDSVHRSVHLGLTVSVGKSNIKESRLPLSPEAPSSHVKPGFIVIDRLELGFYFYIRTNFI